MFADKELPPPLLFQDMSATKYIFPSMIFDHLFPTIIYIPSHVVSHLINIMDQMIRDNLISLVEIKVKV